MIRSNAILAVCALVACGLMSPERLAARVQERIAQRIDSSMPEKVRGNVHPQAQRQFDQGRMGPTTVLSRMVMTFKRTPEQQAELEKLLDEQQDPSSSNYHRWLTPEQFGERFGLSEADLAKVTEWLQSRGFEIVETPPGRTYLAFHGTVGQVDSVFRTEIHHYNVEGEEHFANASDPVLPGALASVVMGIDGLHDFKPRPHGVKVQPRLTSWYTGNHFLVPDDFATIYDIKPLRDLGLDGTGQQIAVVGQSDLLLSNIQAFRRNAGMVASDPQVVLVPGSPDPGVVSGDLVEADLDIEWSGAVAPGATIIYVNSGNGAFDALMYAINNNVAPVISVSYGRCETLVSTAFLNSLATAGQQANAQGQTILVASGDAGAADCDANKSAATHGLAVDIPAALPYVTGVGGTTFNEAGGTFWNTCCAGLTQGANNIFGGSALSYIPEIAWNDGGTQGSTGGGVSSKFGKPAWQSGSGVPADGQRDVPDVAFTASGSHDGYLICRELFDQTGKIDQGPSCVDGFRDGSGTDTVPGSFHPVGGTSAGAPAMAGVVALLNQMTGTAQGNINPRLYQLAAISSDAYHDITSGNNIVSCSSGSLNCPSSGTMGYSTGPGYDPVTGLGSIDVANLAMEWVNVAITPNPIRFGNVLTNTVKTVRVTIRNNNGPSLNISGIAISGDFTQTNDCPATLSFGASCTVSVTLPPTPASTATGTLTVNASDSANPHQIPISGTIGDLAMQLTRPSRVVRSEANPAPPAGSVQPAASSQTSTTTSGATAEVVSTTTAVGTPNLLISPVHWTSQGRGTVTVTNRETAAITIGVRALGNITEESDCGGELEAWSSCDIKFERKQSDSTGELEIVTPSGSHRVRVASNSGLGE